MAAESGRKGSPKGEAVENLLSNKPKKAPIDRSVGRPPTPRAADAHVTRYPVWERFYIALSRELRLVDILNNKLFHIIIANTGT
jgi:hypothetical protein